MAKTEFERNMSKQEDVLSKAKKLKEEIDNLKLFIADFIHDEAYHKLFIDKTVTSNFTICGIFNFGCGRNEYRIEVPNFMRDDIGALADKYLKQKVEELNELLKIDKE